jgi:hypothetical protein
MRQSQPLPESTHFAIDFGADDQMPVIGHQAKRKQFQLHTLERFGNDSLERFVVSSLVKNGCSAVGPIEHVIDRASFVGPLGSPHFRLASSGKAARIPPEAYLVNEKGT